MSLEGHSDRDHGEPPSRARARVGGRAHLRNGIAMKSGPGASLRRPGKNVTPHVRACARTGSDGRAAARPGDTTLPVPQTAYRPGIVSVEREAHSVQSTRGQCVIRALSRCYRDVSVLTNRSDRTLRNGSSSAGRPRTASERALDSCPRRAPKRYVGTIGTLGFDTGRRFIAA